MDQIKTVLLTGGNGFVGSFILKKLLQDNFVPVLLLREQANIWRIKEVITYCKTYIINQPGQDYKFVFDTHHIDAIIHTATDYGRSNELSEILNTNVVFPIRLLEAGVKRGVKLFLNADSFFAKPGFNQDYLKNYTESKRILGKLLSEFAGEIKTANLRLEHVFGEYDSEDKFITSIIKRLLNNNKDIALTKGDQKRDFIYVEDVANAFIVVIKNIDRLKKHQEFEVGTGKSISIRSLVEEIVSALGSSSKLNFGELATRQGDIQDSFANTKALEKLGWKPVYTLNNAINNIIKIEKERFEL